MMDRSRSFFGRWKRGGVAVAVALLTPAALTGCATRPAPGVSGVAAIHAAEYDRVFDAAVRVLRDEGMRVDRQDARFGVITTMPAGAPTLFEPWRPGNRSLGQALDSTVNDQRRRVTITLEPYEVDDAEEATDVVSEVLIGASTDPPAAYLLRVDVQVERRVVPVHYLTRSMAGHAVMRPLRAAPEELARRNVAGSYWQSLGRDAALEGLLAAAIIRASMVP